MSEFEVERRILELRPDLASDSIQIWCLGMSGCTSQSKEGAMRDLLYLAKAHKPMPWEPVEINSELEE